MAFYDAIYRGQAQACSPAHFFGGKKRFKYAFLGFFVDAHTGIRDRDFNVSAGFHLIWFEITAVQDDIFSLQKQIPTVGHGLPGIDVKIEQDLLDLSTIDFRRPEVLRKVCVNPDLFFCAGKQ